MAAHATTTAPTLGAGFDVVEKTVLELQNAMTNGKTTAQQLVRLYLARIAAIDNAGPQLNSVIELNPDALTIAARDAMETIGHVLTIQSLGRESTGLWRTTMDADIHRPR